MPLCQQSQDCGTYEIDDTWHVLQRLGALLPLEYGCDANVLEDPTACDAGVTQTTIGSNRTISPICYVQLESLNQPITPGETKPRDFGPDSSRHIDCDATESIAPASALDIASVTPEPYESYLYVPAAGKLALTGSQITAFVARKGPAAFAARKRPARPGFIPIKINVTQPGSVHVRFRLNRAAKRLLARRHKLTLRVSVTLTLPRQGTITRVHTITLIQPPKHPSARQRRRQARRLCIREHRQQAKVCDRI